MPPRTVLAPLGFVAAGAALSAALPLTLPVAAVAQSAQSAQDSQSSTPAVVVRRVTLNGAHALKARTVVAAVARVALGKPDNAETLRNATRAVNTLYRDKGFPVAQVVSAEVTPEGVLRLEIVEGRVRRIVVRGNKRTRTSTILEALATRPGDAYNANDVRDDRSRLARLGFFNDVTIAAQVPGTVDELPDGVTPAAAAPDKVEPGSDRASDKDKKEPSENNASPTPDTPPPPGNADEAAPLPPGEDRVGDVDLVVRVQERQTASVAATLGYAEAVGPVGFLDLSELNLGGTGQSVGVQWQRATNSYYDTQGNLQRGDSRQAVHLAYERPALGLRSTAYRLDVYDQNTVFLPYFTGVNYTIRTFERRKGISARVGHALRRNLTGYITARHDDVGYDFSSLYDPDNGITADDFKNFPSQTIQNQAQGRVGALGVVLVADGRDAADNPHRGYLGSLTFEDSGRLLGGNTLFRQATLDLRQYASLARRRSTSRENKESPVLATRLMAGLSSGTVPLPEYYFLGGYEVLRGYELYSLYGDRMLLGSAELRVPLSAGVQGVGFVDAGNTWLPGTAFGSGGVKAGAGIGLRFLSPIGPIRFDAAYGDRFRTYISLGQSF